MESTTFRRSFPWLTARIPRSEAARAAWSTRVMVLALAAQLWISLPAWVSGWRAFPLVPAIPGLPLQFGSSGDLLLGGLLLLGLGLLLWQPWHRGATCLVLGSCGLLILEDVNRCQPWLYLYLVSLAAGLLTPRGGGAKERLQIWALLLAGTWFWSGAMKLNVSFQQEFFPGLMEVLGMGELAAACPWLAYACGGLEAFAGIGMLFPACRKLALVAAFGVHSFILLGLGPLGLNWNPVVWPWNLAFMALAVLVFAGRREPVRPGRLRRPALAFTALLVVLLPVLNLFGAWDHFLSGSYYSGRLPDAIFYYDQADRPVIPVSARPHVLQVRETTEDLIPLEFWSLGELALPGYPEVRVKKQLGRQLCACLRHPGKAGVRITRKVRWASRQEILRFSCAELEGKSTN